ncbi:MAG: pirin family protein [Cyanobacteria bacterium P01_H01_bin.121]
MQPPNQLQRNAPLQQNRAITLIVPGVKTADGAGVQLTRFLGTTALPRLDPFLLLDMMYSDQPQDYTAGFPAHPHRGFETVTYVLAGCGRHQDNQGHSGLIKAGGVQWMTAGRGIIHSEMPESVDGLQWGFQLWLNLPAAQKMTPPRYQEFDAHKIPVEQPVPGIQVRVIAGCTSQGTQGPIQPSTTEPIYWDLSIASGQIFTERLPSTHNSFILVYEGQAAVLTDIAHSQQASQQILSAGNLAVLGAGDRVQIQAVGQTSKLLLLAGKPLNEPVVQQGPFVMNTQAEIVQAIQDYQAGRF